MISNDEIAISFVPWPNGKALEIPENVGSNPTGTFIFVPRSEDIVYNETKAYI